MSGPAVLNLPGRASGDMRSAEAKASIHPLTHASRGARRGCTGWTCRESCPFSPTSSKPPAPDLDGVACWLSQMKNDTPSGCWVRQQLPPVRREHARQTPTAPSALDVAGVPCRSYPLLSLWRMKKIQRSMLHACPFQDGKSG
jgi:hypothetical protein